MKRFVLILRICVPLVILMALILPGCNIYEYVNHVLVSKSTVVVGEKVGLSIKSEEFGFLGCTKTRDDVEVPGSEYQWNVVPSAGATVKNGFFVASEPGTYIVSPKNNGMFMGEGSTNVPATIVVQGTAAETSAADTTATKATTATTAKTVETTAAATTTEPSEVTTDTEETSTETDAVSTETDTTTTESDANLIHGVVPTKVTAIGASSDGTMTGEFWNVGKLGGEQYAKAKFVVLAGGESIIWEGTFTGGPNGEFDVTTTWNNQTTSDKAYLKDGKTIDDLMTVNNPEAFDGWVD